jgi:hypothetical protein
VLRSALLVRVGVGAAHRLDNGVVFENKLSAAAVASATVRFHKLQLLAHIVGALAELAERREKSPAAYGECELPNLVCRPLCYLIPFGQVFACLAYVVTGRYVFDFHDGVFLAYEFSPGAGQLSSVNPFRIDQPMRMQVPPATFVCHFDTHRSAVHVGKNFLASQASKVPHVLFEFASADQVKISLRRDDVFLVLESLGPDGE